MNDYIPETLEEEISFIQSYINTHPYPSYGDITKKINSFKTNDQNILFTVMSWAAEYGKQQHDWCKTIYENINDDKLCKEMGIKINDLGEFPALQACYYIIYNFSPFAQSKNTTIRHASKILEHQWDGIGQWKA